MIQIKKKIGEKTKMSHICNAMNVNNIYNNQWWWHTNSYRGK